MMRKVSIIALVLIVLLAAGLFWVNRYRYEKTGSTIVRINNWTGHTCTLREADAPNPIDAALSAPNPKAGDIFDQVAAQTSDWSAGLTPPVAAGLTWTDCK